MKKLIIILVAFLNSPIVGWAQSKVWFELDGIYWQKYGLETFSEVNSLFRGMVRPWLGLNVGNSWAMGLMGDYSSYRLKEYDLVGEVPIYGPAQNENDELVMYGYSSEIYQLSRKINRMAFGAFLRKEISLGQKTSVNLSFFGLGGGKTTGQFEVYPRLGPCIACLKLSGPITIDYEESFWRFGMDLGFAYELKSWVSVGLRTNALQFVKSSIIPVNSDLTDITWLPLYQLPYGDRYEFGSGIAREGVRFSVQLRPF